MMCRGRRGVNVAETAAKQMSERFFPRDDYFMRLALREAEQALEHEDVPIGAVVVRRGEVLAAAHNERELRQDPVAHAEIIAVREAARAAGTWRLLDAVNANPYWGELEHYHNFGRARLYALLIEYGFEPLHYRVSERYRVCMEVIARRG